MITGGASAMKDKDIFKDPEFRQGLKDKFKGWTDDDIDHLTPAQRNLISNLDKLHKHKLVAEVVEVKGCAYRPRIGDKYVFTATGRLIPEESTFPKICAAAIAQMISWVWMTHDRVLSGVDTTQPFFLDRVRCLDMGPERGGWGNVVFKMYIQKED